MEVFHYNQIMPSLAGTRQLSTTQAYELRRQSRNRGYQKNLRDFFEGTSLPEKPYITLELSMLLCLERNVLMYISLSRVDRVQSHLLQCARRRRQKQKHKGRRCLEYKNWESSLEVENLCADAARYRNFAEVKNNTEKPNRRLELIKYKELTVQKLVTQMPNEYRDCLWDATLTATLMPYT